jgi:hypothetical protein
MADNRDFLFDSGSGTLAQIDAELAACQADLAAYKATGDRDAAAQTIRQISNLKSERRNLEYTWQEHVASQTPRQPPPLTDSEMQALPPDKMTLGSALEMINRTSRYAKDLSVNDPFVRHGAFLAQQRRSRGE